VSGNDGGFTMDQKNSPAPPNNFENVLKTTACLKGVLPLSNPKHPHVSLFSLEKMNSSVSVGLEYMIERF